MAQNAADEHRMALTEPLRLLSPFPGRWEFTVRLSLICALTTLVTSIYQTPEPALTAYLAFFMNKPDRTTSVVMSIVMVVLGTILIGFVFLLARIVIDDPLWRLACMMVVSFVFLFMGAASKLKPVASLLALLVAYSLDVLGSAPGGELVTRGLLYAWLFAGIPAGVSILINLLFGPAPRRLAEVSLAARLRVGAKRLRRADEETRRELVSALREGTTEIAQALKMAGVERTATTEHLAALTSAAESTSAILLLIDLIDRDPEAALPQEIREQIAATLEEMATILDDGAYPVEISLGEPQAELPPSALAEAVFARMNGILVHFAEPAAPKRSAPASADGGFFAHDAFTNPDHTMYALKTTAAAMFCYVLYSLLNWPGIHTSFITCYIVALGTTAETIEKLTLRILGCLLGAAAGIAAIVFLIPDLTSIGSLMAVVFVGTLAGAWVAAGTPRIAYAGFQIAFALFLCVIQGAKPEFDMVVARDRIIGILLGDIVTYLVFTNIWPVSVSERLDAAIAKLLRDLGALARGRSDHRRTVSEICGNLGRVAEDIGLSRFEPSSVRRSDQWIGTRSGAVDEIASLVSPLSLAVGWEPQDVAQRLENLAAQVDREESGPPSIPTDGERPESRDQVEISAAAAGVLRRLIDAPLEALEQALQPQHQIEQEIESHAPA